MLIVLFIIAMFLVMFFALAILSNIQENKDSSQNTKNAQVAIKKGSFKPKRIKIPKGSVVVWKNEDLVSYDIVSADANFYSPPIYPGDQFIVKFTRPGIFQFYRSNKRSVKTKVIVDN